jgi:hypothetical protein
MPLMPLMPLRHMLKRSLTLMVLALWTPTLIAAQIENPVPEPIVNEGLSVQVVDIARLPDTHEVHENDRDPGAFARVSYVRDLPDGRRFANDSRGFLYLLDDDNPPALYADAADAFPFAIYDSLQSGFMGFDFHPDFATNGLFYTVHSEATGNPAAPDFVPPGFSESDVTFQSVITEWRATDPAANVFEGTRRELLRAGHVLEFFRHPIGHVGFNPTSEPGDADYGLLYTSGSDFGFSNGGGPNANSPDQTQRLDTIVTAILRFNPASPSETGGEKGLGDYTIPAVNQFAADGDDDTLGEIYAYGFRNAHRLSWDLEDGTMFAGDIGMSQIEEINIVREGLNYGWMQREGYFDNGVARRGGQLIDVFPLPSEILNGRVPDGFTYPVAMYDHGEGQSITAGFTYHGQIPALQGKFVFGDIVRGRIFVADLAEMHEADDLVPQTVANVEELQLYVLDDGGNRRNVTLRELVDETMGGTVARTDLQISRSSDGEIFLTSRQDGVIRMLVP